MDKVKLGSQGAVVSRLGLGCMGMSEFYGQPNDPESASTLLRALDLGLTFLDTSDAYGIGDNELLLGKTLKGRRDEAFIATKFGLVRRKDDEGFLQINSRPEYIHEACDASLQRLGVDHIDLYYQHRVDSNTPIEETVGAMAELVQAGKVKYIGLSEASPTTIRRAHKVHPITALQTEYSLWERHVERDLLATVRELGIGFVAYSPLGRGFLTGKINKGDIDEADVRAQGHPRFTPGNFDQNRALVDRLKTLADRRQITPGQLALAWVLSKGEDIVPIPGTKRVKYLEENAAAAAIRLAPEEVALIEATIPAAAVAGERNTPENMNLIDR